MNMLGPQITESTLIELYGPREADVDAARSRLTDLCKFFSDQVGQPATSMHTAAGRTELGGNHTDHQHGNVLAGSVNLDTVAAAATTAANEIRVISTRYPADVVKVGDWEPRPEEEGRSIALVRGICRALSDRGYTLSGATIATDSRVPGGSGLSSSAAFEVLLGGVLNHLFCEDSLDDVEIAQIGQFAENAYFGKPSGLLDQMACSVGGVIEVDFGDPTHPELHRIDFSLTDAGYALCIIDSGADHSDLTDDYAAITEEMGAVAKYFDAPYLRAVDPDRFWADLAGVRAHAGDRATLRAIHFFNEDARVPEQAAALKEGRMDDYLQLVNDSGESSAVLLQNVYSAASPTEQAVGVTIALARHLLGSEGAVRVHGGGFAGTVQAYVPTAQVDSFRHGIDKVLGDGACQVLQIRPVGGAVLAS